MPPIQDVSVSHSSLSLSLHLWETKLYPRVTGSCGRYPTPVVRKFLRSLNGFSRQAACVLFLLTFVHSFFPSLFLSSSTARPTELLPPGLSQLERAGVKVAKNMWEGVESTVRVHASEANDAKLLRVYRYCYTADIRFSSGLDWRRQKACLHGLLWQPPRIVVSLAYSFHRLHFIFTIAAGKVTGKIIRAEISGYEIIRHY